MADFNLDLDSFDFGDFDSLDTGIDVKQQPTPTPDVANIVTNLKKRAMVVFFVIDISGSMKGARIGAVNDAIRNVIPELRKREKGNTSAEIKVAVLEFSTRANWRTLSPEPVSTYKYNDIEQVYGGTNYGTAFAALNEKLSNRAFLSSTAGAYTPLIIFMTDGKPSDMGLYPEELKLLKQNKWFKHSTRAGIAIEEGALSPECKRVLLEFTENESNIYEAKNTVILAKQIELVTLTGVDLVTQQGSIQNSSTPVDTTVTHTPPPTPVQNTPKVNLSRPSSSQTPPPPPPSAPPAPPADNTPPPTSTSSPTLPIADIDWENDFNF